MKLALFVLSMIIATSAFGRDSAQVREFRKTHPCPITGKTTGACKGVDAAGNEVRYVVDHKRPLCLGGEDSPDNMQWQEYEASLSKDVLERELCKLKTSCYDKITTHP